MRRSQLKKTIGPALLAVLLLLPGMLSAQIWKRTEEKPTPIWRVKGVFNLDFYPYSELNNERFYNSAWQFNYTTGAELLYTTQKASFTWGGGLLYSIKDFNQNLKTTDTSFRNSVVKQARHTIRYTEIPVIAEYKLINTESTQILADGGLMFGFREKSITYNEPIKGPRDTIFINDQEFGRFLWGLHYGLGFRQSIMDQLSIETGLYGRLYFNDLDNNQYVNFSSFGIRLKLVYRLSNVNKEAKADK